MEDADTRSIKRAASIAARASTVYGRLLFAGSLRGVYPAGLGVLTFA